MAKHFDLTSILSNEKPTITIGEHTFTVNDEKTNVLLMNEGMKSLTPTEAAEFAVERLLGKEQKATLDSFKLSMTSYFEIFYALVACVNNEEIETVKARFQK